MCDLTNVGRGRDGTKADTETQDETTSEKLAFGLRRGLHASSDNDDERAGEHTPSSPEVVVDRTGEEDSSDRTNVVHGKDDTGALIDDFLVEEVHVRLHTVQTTHQAAVVAVQATAEVGDEENGIQTQHVLGPRRVLGLIDIVSNLDCSIDVGPMCGLGLEISRRSRRLFLFVVHDEKVAL